jgi:hypothetical protein
MHAAHWRSVVAEPASDMPKPTAHVVHAVHSASPADAVKVPALQTAHVRSLLAVATAVM